MTGKDNERIERLKTTGKLNLMCFKNDTLCPGKQGSREGLPPGPCDSNIWLPVGQTSDKSKRDF